MTQTQVSGSGIKNNVITNSHLHSAANISGSKLADSGVTAGSYGSSSATLSLTINAQGLITAASTNAITQVGGSNGVDFNDNVKARFGTGNDLQIFHTGSASSIINNTGLLQITSGSSALYNQSDNIVWVTKNNATETMAKFIADGAVELYYDNDRKFRTTSSGGQIESATGDTYLVVRAEEDDASVDAVLRLSVQNASATSIIQFGDQDSASIGQLLYEHADNSMRFRTNGSEHWRITSAGHLENNSDTGILKLGASDDLQIYHDGSNSYLADSGTGALVLLASTFALKNAANSENIISGFENGAVELYHDNGRKFSTTAGGLEFFGRSVDCQVNWNNSSNGQRYGGVYGYLESGVPIMSFLKSNGSYSFVVNDNGVVRTYGTVRPNANNSYDLGTTSHRWANIYSTGLNVSGGTSPATITHTGGNALTLSRSSKNLNFNANYGAANTHATIDVTSGMELRFQVAGSDRVKLDSSGHWLPTTDNARDLGSTSLRWRNIYTNDLNLSNEGSSNDVDGTWGSFTIQEGAKDLFLINKRNGKKYKFNLTEVL